MNATLLSAKELAVKLGVSEKSIQRAYRKGEIPVERLCNLLRFDLERPLISGELSPGDVPAAWNETFTKYFGLTPPDAARGCLQDIHWSMGGIGYFPTYTLGNMNAAQLFAAAKRDLGDLDGQFARGEFAALKHWLNENIHRRGKQYRAPRLIEVVTGRPLSHEPLVQHLKTKFGELYGV